MLKRFLKRIKEKKGITGADVAAAVSVIVLTVGIVTAIYVNTINKSKDNIRYANAVRIATNIMENIQKRPYEYLTTVIDSTVDKKVSQNGNNGKIFDTKIPNGFEVTVTAQKGSDEIDVARDVFVKVKYKSNNTYKTITLNTVKEKELMDMTNDPDISLIPGYNPDDGKYYYPVINDGANNYKVTSTEDINWFNYEKGNYAVVCVSSSNINVGGTASGNLYVWIPRFVVSKDDSKTGLESIQFLYGSSKYKIALNTYGSTLISYGLSFSGSGGDPDKFDEAKFQYSGFSESDGLSGVWYLIGSTENSENINNIAKMLNSKIHCNNASLP